MARIRTIKPEFFHSLTLAECSTRARLLFVGLWTYCDDEGKAVDEPRIIKGALFPLDDDISSKDVDADLCSLEDVGAIRRYQVEGKRYLVVCSWHHQKIDRPSKSRIPAPPEPLDEDSSNPPRGFDDSHPPYLGPGPSTGDHGSRTPGSGSDDDSQHNSQERAHGESSSSDFDAVIQVISRAALSRAKAKGKAIEDDGGWLIGTRKNMRSEVACEITSLLDTGMTVPDAAAALIGDVSLTRWALRQEKLSHLAEVAS